MQIRPIVYAKEHLGIAAHKQGPRISRIRGSEGRDISLTSLVVGHDRQSESQEALRAAMDLSERLNAYLHVVHVVSLGDYPIDPDLPDWEGYSHERLAEEQATVIEALRAHTSGWSYYVGRGDPARRLIEIAEENDALMIVVGSRGEGVRASLGRLIEPAVSHRLIQESRCPVLVVSHSHERSEVGRFPPTVADRN